MNLRPVTFGMIPGRNEKRLQNKEIMVKYK